MISKNPTVEGQEEEDNQRHINVVKNKLSGWHGIVHTDLEYKIAVCCMNWVKYLLP